MNARIQAALTAVMALGQRAVAIAQEGDKPGMQQLHDDAAKAVNSIEADAEQIGEATIETFATKMLTPAVGADGAASLAATYARAGEAAIASKLGFTLPNAA